MDSKTETLSPSLFYQGMSHDEFVSKKKILSEIELAVFDLLLSSDHALNTREIRNAIIDDWFQQLFYEKEARYIKCEVNAKEDERTAMKQLYEKKIRDQNLRAMDVEQAVAAVKPGV